tara:strand:- start:218 stop:1417 length:1200 start_codon:yes stop_codon:yes gene_type:complete
MSTLRGLRELHVQNFRCLRDVTVPLGRLNVLVGPNAAGKSTFLDVIQFLGDSVRQDLVPALEERGGFDQVLFRGDPLRRSPRSLPRVNVSVKARVTQHASESALDHYDLQFWKVRRGLVREESFQFKRTRGAGRRIKIKGSGVEFLDEDRAPEQLTLLQEESLGLSTLPKLSDEQGGKQVRQIADLFTTFRVFEVSVARAKRPASFEDMDTLRPDASNLSAFLIWLADTDMDAFERLESDAREMVPGLAKIKFEGVASPTSGEQLVHAQLLEEGLSQPSPLWEASYGTVRALSLLALLYDPNPPLLTCVEEIDHGLHPHVFDRLVDRLREASQRTQFVIATHSPALVNRLDPGELIVCERTAGASQIPAIDSHLVAEMEKTSRLGLGELWFSGTLGGVP